jgi:hypothetical protein
MLLDLCERFHAQQPTDRKKLYATHEPDVQCISKGKARRRYYFGQKVGFSTTNRSKWIVGVKVSPGNPFDGHAPAATIAGVEKASIRGKVAKLKSRHLHKPREEIRRRLDAFRLQPAYAAQE